uniref:Uncharacterized protein n=1 Tax=Acrobeloides nanus TaxID=290746 RepID=A0A914C348_9BILA
MAGFRKRSASSRMLARLKLRRNYTRDDILDFQMSLLQMNIQDPMNSDGFKVLVENPESVNPYDDVVLKCESDVSLDQTQFDHDYTNDENEENKNCGNQIQLHAHFTLSAANLNRNMITRDFSNYFKRFFKWLFEVVDEYPTQFDHDSTNDENEENKNCGNQIQLHAQFTLSATNLNRNIITRDLSNYFKRFFKWLFEVVDEYPRFFSSICLGLLFFSMFYLFCFWLRNYLMGWLFWFVEVIWPIVHVWLRSAESICHSAGSFFEHVDDVGQSFFCDLAEIWCHHYNQMCSSRCTFTELALERMRKR